MGDQVDSAGLRAPEGRPRRVYGAAGMEVRTGVEMLTPKLQRSLVEGIARTISWHAYGG